jgi:SAM-dependent methyltransferase
MITSWKCWQGPGGLAGGLYEILRRRVNGGLVSYLAERTSLRPGHRVLEAGSGTAGASSLFAQCVGVTSVALDIDLDALREARKRDSSLRAVVGDLAALPFRTAAFDLVWNSSTFEHVSAPSETCREMARVVRPNRHVFIGVPYRWGPLAFQPAIAGTGAGRWIGRTFSGHMLAHLMRLASLEPLEVRHYFLRVFVGVLARKTDRTMRAC